MPGTLLDDAQISDELGQLDGWRRDGDTITRSFEFADFSEAFGFMARVALAAEKRDHHPDWSNSWNRVEIAITNHAVGGISDLCVDLAAAIDAAAAT